MVLRRGGDRSVMPITSPHYGSLASDAKRLDDPYTGGMPPIRFSLRHLFLAVTLVAVGAALLRLAFSNGGLANISPAGPAIALFGWCAAGMSIGAAITGLWQPRLTSLAQIGLMSSADSVD
jgi:hypothetical protein